MQQFDDLIRAFQWAFVSSRDTLEKRHEETLRRICEGNENVDSRSPYLIFSLPRTGVDTDEYETVTLPMSSFRERRRPQISMLSLEFECELKEKRPSDASRSKKMVMNIRKRTGASRKNWRRVLIVFQSADRYSGEVRVDGELLMEVPPYERPPVRGAPATVKRSFFQVLQDLWRRIWRTQEFVLSDREAGRIREIPGQADHGAADRKFGQDVDNTTSSRYKGGPGCA